MAQGHCYFNGVGVTQDLNAAVALYHSAAAKGNVDAMYNLGASYSEGEGRVQDRTTAFEWYCKAANLGHPASQFNLGLLYYGDGANDSSDTGTTVGSVMTNHLEAFGWFSKAAQQGIVHLW